MTLNSQVQVTMPTQGIRIGRSGKSRPVYKTIRSYRNNQGTATKERVLIGKQHPDTGKLIPNERYWTLYGRGETDQFIPVFNSVRQVGLPFVVGAVMNNLGLTEILKESFGAKRADLIKTSVIYMVAEGNVFEGIEDYCSMHLLNEAPLNSQQASVLFASITHDERMNVLKSWASKQQSGGYLAYDVTSFSTHAKSIADSEYGYNRDGEKIPQINLGCFVHEPTALPVFYVTYPGSIVDKSHLPYIMAYNDELGLTDIGFVLDRGFCSTANVQYLSKAGYDFIIGVEKRHKTTKMAIDAVRSCITEVKHMVDYGAFGVARHGCYYGVTATMHVYFDRALASSQLDVFSKSLDRDENFLRQKTDLTSQEIKKHSNFFIFERAGNGTFSIKRDTEKIEIAAKNFGFFCILTNTSLKNSEVIAKYRRKDVIEKCFDDVKNYIDMKRLRTHTTATTDGKLFCAFLALIVVADIGAKLGELMREKSLSKSGFVREMNKIYVASNKEGMRLLNPVTKTQRLLMNGLGLDEEKLRAFVCGG